MTTVDQIDQTSEWFQKAAEVARITLLNSETLGLRERSEDVTAAVLAYIAYNPIEPSEEDAETLSQAWNAAIASRGERPAKTYADGIREAASEAGGWVTSNTGEGSDAIEQRILALLAPVASPTKEGKQ